MSQLYTLELNKKQLSYIESALVSWQECDEDILRYPTSFSETQINEIAEEVKDRAEILFKIRHLEPE